MTVAADEQRGWQPLGFEGLKARLLEAKRLLEQAAAVGLAQDVARLQALAEAERDRERDKRGRPDQRRYR